MLIRAVYRGVFFHQPLTPGTSTVDVTVYEPTTNPGAIQVPLRLLVFQPNGDKLMVGEEYSIQNNSNPPAAYFKQDGNFEFTIPAGRGARSGFHLWPFGHAGAAGHDRQRQGPLRHRLRVSAGTKRRAHFLHLPVHAAISAAFANPPRYDAQRVLLVIPPTMQVSSAGFNAAGTEQGFNVFSKDSMKAGTGFDVSVSGTAPPPADASAASAPDQVNGRDSGAGPTDD